MNLFIRASFLRTFPARAVVATFRNHLLVRGILEVLRVIKQGFPSVSLLLVLKNVNVDPLLSLS